METKELNRKIDALGKKNAAVEAEIQTLGLVCLGHLEHGNNGPIVRLFNVLRRGQQKPFLEWVLAFGKASKNTDKLTKDAMPIVYDKSKNGDIEGATAKPWFDFADSKDKAIAEAFDLQKAVMALLKRAANAGAEHSKLVAMATAIGIPESLVPATVEAPTGAEPALL